MTTGEPRYLSQGVDYLGFLEAKLRDLRGIATLVYELIQNADDVKDERGQPGTSRISFDIREDGLIVENDGTFREIDFERMRNVASGGKREEEGTTGAFGIGFIAVYQITDHPEIFSGGRHWVIRPEASEGRRITEWDVRTEGTRFRLPWAFDPESEVRSKLRLEAVRREQLPKFEKEIKQAISLAALFLKQLKVLELKRSGELVKRVEREAVEDDQILILDGDQTFIWRIFRGKFEDEAARLRRHYRQQIEAKRRSDVLLAISDEPLGAGRLFAVLPSETVIPLPFHINADFFPSSDRKRIIFGDDYQSEWNRAAVRAVARALATGFDELPNLLGHEGLWHLLESLDQCSRQVYEGKYDQSFACFWEEIAPSLQRRQIAFTSTERWVLPGDARLLESKDEEDALPILESLGVPIMHPNLRRYFGLMRQREIGTPLLSVQDIANTLTSVGLDRRVPLAQTPSYLRTVEAWQVLWQALDALLERRQSPSDRQQAEDTLRSCAIALGNDNALWPPSDLFQGDAETKALFPYTPWLVERNEPHKMPSRLVVKFGAKEAIRLLAARSAEQLQAAWRSEELDIKALYSWFEARKSSILSTSLLKEELCALPIWPVAGQLRPLENLYIPGGFDDPLKLSALVDLRALGGRKEFLQDLGVQELTFETYAREQVPRVLEENADLPATSRRELVQLLAQRLGEIRDHSEIQDRLSRLPLVECTDGHFRAAGQVYAQTDVARILGDWIHIATAVSESTDAVRALYEWLGVVQDPRPNDVIQRIRELTADPPDDAARQVVERVFEYLVNQWPKWDDDQKQHYSTLRRLAWLPGTRGRKRWYKPDVLYAVFQSYLFETQANFLGLPRLLQNQAGGVGLIEFLDIGDTPPPVFVVRHLLTCSEQGTEVNREVYRFLNDKADEPVLDRLKGAACLLLPDGNYVRADQVYWGEHPFGPFRYQLGSGLRQYNALFERLGVREHPEDRDFIQVLLEIREQYGKRHTILDDQTHEVVMRCWEQLSTALEMERLTANDLKELRGKETVPNPRRLLTKPEHLFFEDRAGLAAKFLGFLDNSVIARPQGAWQAMEAVGVRRLSQAVELRLLEFEGSTDDRTLAERVKERRPLIARVIESEKASGADGMDRDALYCLQFQQARKLVIQYSLRAFQQRRMTEPEAVPALLNVDEHTLLTVHENGHIPWPAVSRELAYATKPLGEIGGLAGGIKEALANNSFDEACRTLDELGYPPLQQRIETEVISGDPIGELGGDELSPEDAVAAILGREDTQRADMPDAPPESPPSVGAPGAGPKEPAKKQKPQGKLRTYVVGDGDAKEGEPDTAAAAHRSEVDQAGIKHVLEYERICGWTPTEMPHHHKGYDVESLDVEGHKRYIEVKSQSGDWSTWNAAGLTSTQFETAREKGEQFWLYVVERATSDDYQVYCIQDPANRVNQYLFDDGWQALAEFEEVSESAED